MPAIQNVYNHYLSTYGVKSKQVSRYDTHKKSELRNIYNTIVKINKDSPLYKVNMNDNLQKYAIDLKESARELNNTLSSFSNEENSITGLHRKLASSENPQIAQAQLLHPDSSRETLSAFELEVQELAKPQINLGAYLPSKKLSLPPDQYAFRMQSGGTDYEFQFQVEPTDNNLSIQNRLVSLINNSNIGVNASVETEGDQQSALRLESLSTGIADHKKLLFTVSNSNSGEKNGQAASLLGIDYIAQNPQNASYSINGTSLTSPSNTITVQGAFKVTLKSETEAEKAVTIGLKNDEDTIMDNMIDLIDHYNSMMGLANKSTNAYTNGNRLFKDMGELGSHYKNELESIGFTRQEDGTFQTDLSLLRQAAQEENPEETFSVMNNFKHSLGLKTTKILLDPMEYVNKKLIAYKNPEQNYKKNFVSPYVTSIYSGMMFNSYC